MGLTARCGLLAVLAIVGLLAAPVDAGLAIRQRSNGLPGKPHGTTTDQELLVGSGALRLREPGNPAARSTIVRLDKGVIWEVDPALELYTETTFEHLRMQREEAEKDRENARKLALDRLKGEELEKWLREHGTRADGKRIVSVEKGAWEVRDGTRVERVLITLNGITQVEVWQTDKYAQYKPPRVLFEFYDKCGVFPEDVTAALKQSVELFPWKIVANIDLFAAGTVIETKVEGVTEWPEDATKFEVPSTFRKVKEFPKERIAKKEYKCPICGKPVDPTATPFAEKDKATGEKVYFDEEQHWVEWLQKTPKPSKKSDEKPK